jgi:hypothetical protein
MHLCHAGLDPASSFFLDTGLRRYDGKSTLSVTYIFVLIKLYKGEKTHESSQIPHSARVAYCFNITIPYTFHGDLEGSHSLP